MLWDSKIRHCWLLQNKTTERKDETLNSTVLLTELIARKRGGVCAHLHVGVGVGARAHVFREDLLFHE